MEKPRYAVSYNRDRGNPNWVVCHLDDTWLGSVPRKDTFRPDSTLPADWYHVKKSSYNRSGYARGHHCPSADRTNAVENNSATFLMTNMMQQAANNKSGLWGECLPVLFPAIQPGTNPLLQIGRSDKKMI
jgi:endonuclease G